MTELDINTKSLLRVVKEFIKALGQGRTYSIHKNWYCLFGILWGMPIPIVTIGVDLYSSGIALGFSEIIHIITLHFLSFIFSPPPCAFRNRLWGDGDRKIQ